MKTASNSLFESWSAILIAGACALIVVTKIWLVFRINVNWDEFIFLSYIYDFERGDLGARFQTAYVHLFRWLTRLSGDEMDQVIAARLAMSALLIVSVVLIARLAARWVEGPVIWIAPLAFLSALPVLRHAGSFRADSLLLPMMLVTLVCLASDRPGGRKRIAIAGAFLGLSLAISLKAALVMPVAVSLLLTDPARDSMTWLGKLRGASIRLLELGAWTAATAGLLLAFHWSSLPATDPSTIRGFTSGVAQKAMLDTPFFPRWDYFSLSLESDWPTWTFLLIGAIASLAGYRRAALLSLSLLPLLFYRNAFPYYYVIMLAPVSVLIAVGTERLRRSAGHRTVVRSWLPVIVSVPLALQAGLHLVELRHDEQQRQRATIEAVHQIFPAPVPYIDHSGMIASFPKSNFLMSSWAIENYRSRGRAFMASIVSTHRPPMVLANSPILVPGSAAFDLLLEEDQRYIEAYYVPYWGAVRVAGAETALDRSALVLVELPFPGTYRLVAEFSVVIDGVEHVDGDEIAIPEDAPPHVLAIESETSQLIRLVWAGARPAPPGALPPFVSLYSGL